METEEFIIVYDNGEIERIHGSAHDAFQHARSRSLKFTVYARDMYEEEFGPLDDTTSHFQDKMDSAGEPRVVSQKDAEPKPEPDPYRQALVESYQKLK